MSRAAVVSTIIADPALTAMGFDASNVRTNYDAEQRPTDSIFMVLRWGPLDVDPRIMRGTRNLTIWVHIYREYSTDYVRIDKVIDRLQELLTDIIDVPGEDGYTLTLMDFDGVSDDMKDDGYQTICRSVSFKVLSRKTEIRKARV